MILSGPGFSFDVEIIKLPKNVIRHIEREVKRDNKLCRKLKFLYRKSLMIGGSGAGYKASKLLKEKIAQLKAI